MNRRPAQVTVVLPTYNRSWGLKRAVQSVLAQTYPHFEILIVDDASTDDTEKVARSFTDARVRYYRQPHNVGVGRNWGEGLRQAQTPYVCFLMDDDYQDPTFLENRVRLLEAHPDALLAFSGYRRVRQDGTFLANTQPSCQDDQIYEGPELLDIFLVESRVFVGAMLYRRQGIFPIWKEIERYDLAADLAFNLRLAVMPHARAVFCEALDFNVCIHDGQMMNVATEEVYLTSERIFFDERARSNGEQIWTLRRWYEGLLLGGAYLFADRRRCLSLYWLLKSISLRPMAWRLWRRRLYILAIIARLKNKA